MTAALAKLHIAKKELGLHDDDYRAILTRETGQASAKGLSEAQIGKVLDVLKGMGWTPRVLKQRSGSTKLKVIKGGQTTRKQAVKASRKIDDRPVAKKARALWISLHHLGVVRDPSELALESFCHRQLGVDRLAWAKAGDMHRLIEALKKMAEREGWPQASDDILTTKRFLVEAQLRRLKIAIDGLDGFGEAALDRLIVDLGRRIRGA